MSRELYFLTEQDVMTILAATGQSVELHDFGSLAAAVARPQASAFGEDAYPDPWVKAAALLHSLTRNHPFLDGNKRAGWNAAWVFIEVNGIGWLDPHFDVDAAEAFVLSVATGAENDLPRIAAGLRTFSV